MYKTTYLNLPASKTAYRPSPLPICTFIWYHCFILCLASEKKEGCLSMFCRVQNPFTRKKTHNLFVEKPSMDSNTCLCSNIDDRSGICRQGSLEFQGFPTWKLQLSSKSQHGSLLKFDNLKGKNSFIEPMKVCHLQLTYFLDFTILRSLFFAYYLLTICFFPAWPLGVDSSANLWCWR